MISDLLQKCSANFHSFKASFAGKNKLAFFEAFNFVGFSSQNDFLKLLRTISAIKVCFSAAVAILKECHKTQLTV